MNFTFIINDIWKRNVILIYIYFSVIYCLLTKLREPQREFRLIGELEIGEWWALWLGDRYSDSDLLGLIVTFDCSDSLNIFVSS